ncbi:MAG: T9SS type A sorting domain-containing protein [Tannerella sp.]|jgi:hypothetical protein|nr:T9SS type A sorting domain-containing protein [Tannerella sp.]
MKSKRFFLRILVFIEVLALPVSMKLSAQISEGGIPPSFQYQPTLRSFHASEQVPVTFNVADLKRVDEWRVSQGAPLAVSTLIPVSYNTENSGVWTTLSNGEKIWQLQLQAKGAIALMLYYADFYIPEGGKLFIYNAEKTQILGAYTHQTHPSGGRFANEFVAGDELTLEYVVSPGDEKPRIHIEAIGYGYNYLNISRNSVSTRASGSCEVNINCEEGDAWQNQKKGVCQMVQKIGSQGYICTASLVNNTAQDLKPYILTATHCSESTDSVASEEDMKQWNFVFYKEREGCDNQSTLSSKTLTGCKKIVSTALYGESDGLLLLLNETIPESYNVYYNGWDRRESAAQSGVGIHHPAGDYKKISTFTRPVTSYTFTLENNKSGDRYAHWNAVFEETPNGHGVTEGGSSGSPLFNEKKLIVGMLSGGSSSCTILYGLNLYSKMSYHWNKYQTSDSTHMDIWLDPVRSRVETLEGRFHGGTLPEPSGLNVTVDDQSKTARLTWKAPASGSPSKYFVYQNNTRIGETRQTAFEGGYPEPGTVQYSVSAVYAKDNESKFINKSVQIAEFKAPVNVKTTPTTTAKKIAVTWDAPLYTQTIFWGENDVKWAVSLDENTPFYFGQLWTPADIRPLHSKTIISVKFYPARNNPYEIYIVQGTRTYKQKIVNQTVNRSNEILLTTPFVIDGTKELIVSIYASKPSASENEYPAICDSGPAVQGKGNILSIDGTTWETLYDEAEPEDFNYNFYIAAVVSSNTGAVPLSTASAAQEISFSGTKKAVPLIAPSSPLQGASVALRSISPTAFPEIAGYNIYRDDSKIATVPSVPARYIDDEPLKKTNYQVAALYGAIEGKRSTVTVFSPVANELIDPNEIALQPSVFSNQVRISGFDKVKLMEIYSAYGKLCLRIENPGETIDTQTLQSGVYFFRVYTVSNEVKTLRGVKSR